MPKMTADEVVAAVRRRYGCQGDGFGPEWASLEEMDLQPGHSSRRIDLLLVRAWSSRPKGHERHAVEVKVSRADLRRELDDDTKWRAWHDVVHRFYLAVPAELNLDGFELPAEWGLLTVTGAGTRETVAATKHDPKALPEKVMVEAFRRASRAEARIRDADVADLAAVNAALVWQVASAQRATATAREAERRWTQRALEAVRLYSEVAEQVHCRCGTEVTIATRPFQGRGGYGLSWEHAGEPGPDRYSGTCRYPGPDPERLAATLDR